jgi:hypothetical protein
MQKMPRAERKYGSFPTKTPAPRMCVELSRKQQIDTLEPFLEGNHVLEEITKGASSGVRPTRLEFAIEFAS